MKRRIIIFMLLLAGAAGVIYYEFLSRTGEIVLTGIVTTDDVIISAQVQGRIQQLAVNQGDTVKKGDLLALIQPESWQADMHYYDSAVEQAASQVTQTEADLRFQQLQTTNQIDQAQANLAAAKADVVQTQATLENTRLNFERETTAFKSGAESPQTYDEARTAYDAQKARVDSAQKQVLAAAAGLALAQSSAEQISVRKAGLEMAKHQLASAQAQQEKAKVTLGYTDIRSPIDGVVDVRAALQGEVVSPGQAIITLINPDNLWVRADVEETYIDRTHLGDILQVRLPSGVTRPGTVFYRGVDADYATQRDVSRTKRDIKTFEVRLRCDNTDRALALGMTAYVTLPLPTPVDFTSTAPSVSSTTTGTQNQKAP